MQAHRTRIKICGITNLSDAQAAVDAGADALGFILVSGSPRCVLENDNALQVAADLPPFVARVAVCRDAADVPVHRFPQFDTLQTYSETFAESQRAGRRLILALRVRHETTVEEITANLQRGNVTETMIADPEGDFVIQPAQPGHIQPEALLLDSWDTGKLGGTGKVMDWALAALVRKAVSVPLILAGGLNPENVLTAVCTVRPFAVDVSSG
ncbi:MAG: phosphoribosylanthranilate isomerase, partial [Armatimonadetes bacterium]|nr:phosphoribosylanthranilate isomerase [Armatimonadota bacterium]